MTTHVITELPADLVKLLVELGPRKLVLVEGKTDRDVFRIWYRERRNEMEFYTPEVPRGGSGVVHLLKEVLAQSVRGRAFGIIDRDFRGDDEIEAALQAPNPHLFILRRYDIENYLLEPEAICEQLELFPAAREEPSPQAMSQKLLEIARQLKTMMAANWVFSEVGGVRHFSPAHDLLSRDVLIEEAARRLQWDVTQAEQRIADKEAQIEPLLASLDTAYTRIKGKHILFHIHKIYIKKELSWEHFANLLAWSIKQGAGVHADIKGIIEGKILV